ncbi:MAG: FadR/GntR family transcriptional regulator [Candidatus Methylomirabilales bacterium]
MSHLVRERMAGRKGLMAKPEQPPALRAVKKTRVYEDIVTQISDLIGQGRLKSGDQLPSERELSETFKVSRTSVREAIRALESMGLVQSRPGDGTFVSAPSIESLIQPMASALFHEKRSQAELFETRRIIEPQLAALAAERATSKDLERMEAILADQEREIAAGGSGVEADSAFHFAIAEAARNAVLLRLVNAIVDLLHQSREKSLQTENRPRLSYLKHREILEALKKGDPEEAGRLMREHIEGIEENIFSPSREAASGAARP